jgi:hypothetical protein
MTIRRLFLLAAMCVLAGGALAPGTAAQGFSDLPGLERAIVRGYISPPTETDGNGAGTPISENAATPVATPDPATLSGVVFLSIGVFQFDGEASAESAFDLFSELVGGVVERDPQFAGGEIVPLDASGNESIHAVAAHVDQDIPFSMLFTVVRDGKYLYVLQGTLVRLDATAEANRMVNALVGTDPGAGPETFDPNGGSTGGLWDVYANVDPVLIEGSLLTDAIVFPDPSSNVESSGNAPLARNERAG